MTEQEAIKVIVTNFCDKCMMTSCKHCAQGKAKEALEKQIPKKPILWGMGIGMVSLYMICTIAQAVEDPMKSMVSNTPIVRTAVSTLTGQKKISLSLAHNVNLLSR